MTIAFARTTLEPSVPPIEVNSWVNEYDSFNFNRSSYSFLPVYSIYCIFMADSYRRVCLWPVLPCQCFVQSESELNSNTFVSGEFSSAPNAGLVSHNSSYGEVQLVPRLACSLNWRSSCPTLMCNYSLISTLAESACILNSHSSSGVTIESKNVPRDIPPCSRHFNFPSSRPAQTTLKRIIMAARVNKVTFRPYLATVVRVVSSRLTCAINCSTPLSFPSPPSPVVTIWAQSKQYELLNQHLHEFIKHELNGIEVSMRVNYTDQWRFGDSGIANLIISRDVPNSSSKLGRTKQHQINFDGQSNF
ncbi:hypothetical protein FB451DRAFT_1177771 [Mycena latifolia]|nr:hypothetical protein FB451DRAFT_1177771 [Mycena latifolia]